MKILAISDCVDPYLYDYYTPQQMKDIDLILSCGDLPAKYLEFLVTVSNVPLLYVHGNHDTAYQKKAPEGCVDIDGSLFDFNGLRILGLGGSMQYNQSPYMYTEQQMNKRIRKLKPHMRVADGFDILLTHAPAYGYGDMDDLPHTGFDCFNELLSSHKPKYMIHGHIHQEYGQFERRISHPAGTTIINAYKKEIVEIEIPNLKKHSFFYPYFIKKY